MRAAVSGVKWSAVSQTGRQVTQVVTTAVLAHFLAPSDFGVVAIATVVVAFLAIFKDLGTAASAIQKRELSRELLSSIFWLNAGFGLVFTALVVVAAPFVAWIMREPDVTPVLRVVAFTFVVSGISALQQALLERELRFKRLAGAELGANLTGAAVGVGCAVAGLGVWSLVAQALVTSVLLTVLLWLMHPWRPVARVSSAELAGIWRFSLNLTGYNVFNYLARNADYLLIGRFLGTTALGYYTLAYNVLLLPLQNVSVVVGRVLYPTMAPLSGDAPAARRVYLQAVELIGFVAFPAVVGLAAVSAPMVLVVFGAAWAPAIPLILVFTPIGILQAIGSSVGPVYMAHGRTDWLFRWGMVSAGLATLGFLAGLPWGILGVAAGYGVVVVLLAYPNFAIPLRLLGLKPAAIVSASWRPLAYSLAMGAAVAGLRLGLDGRVSLPVQLVVLVAAGVAAYLGLALLWSREKVFQFWGTLVSGRTGTGPGTGEAEETPAAGAR